MVKYIVYKCYNSMGRTNKQKLDEFASAFDAICLHRKQKETEFTWYEINVEYEDS